MSEIEIRPARDVELGRVAELRWRWVTENGDTPATPREEFTRRFAEWARRHEHSHQCLVAVRDGEVLGMAWLAVLPRVPTPNALDRQSGDVQCVYVVPHERDAGLGRRLVGRLLDRARQLGLERVVVHSSSRAIPAYARLGFAVSPRLMQTRPA